MKGSDCEQQAIDYDWSLARKNACHLGVQNDEMGELRDEMVAMNTKMVGIDLKMDIIFGGWAVVLITIIALVVKKMWGK